MGYGAQPFGAPAGGIPFGGTIPFGGNGVSNATVTTNQKTRIALTTTTLKISVPWIKLTPITDAPETTIRISGNQNIQAQQGFGAVPFGVMPGMQPGAFGASLPGAPGSFVQGQVVGPPIGGGVVGGQTGAFGAGAAGVCPPVDPAITPERVKALTKKIEELEAAKKAQEEAGKKDAAPAPKEKAP
jgi:hypothetical protein